MPNELDDGMQAIGDTFITNRVNSQLRLRLSPVQIRVGIDKVMALDNPFVAVMNQIIGGNEDAAAAFLSDFLLGVLIPEDEGMEAGPGRGRRFARRTAQRRLVRHLVAEKGLSHADAVAKAESLSDDQYDSVISSVGPLPMQADGEDEQTWFQTILTWFKENWLQILFGLLGLLIML